jgi:hypothetical protein
MCEAVEKNPTRLRSSKYGDKVRLRKSVDVTLRLQESIFDVVTNSEKAINLTKGREKE